MGHQVAGLPNLTISSGSTTSGAAYPVDDAYSLTLYSPATLTGNITIQIEPTSTGTSWVTLQSGGVDVAVNASRAMVIHPISFRQLRLASDAAEAAARTFTITKGILV